MNTLDLNHITIVPAGSASHIPYLVYLARGRDIEQPSIIVLLDSDKAGNEALKALKRGGPKGKQILKPEYVLSISSLQSEVKLPDGKQLVETEDLIPPGILAVATYRYLESVCGLSGNQAGKVTPAAVIEAWADGQTQYDALCSVVKRELGEDTHIDKVGLARSIMEVIQHHRAKGEYNIAYTDDQAFTQNVTILLAKLAQLQRAAERDTTQERISQRLDRSIKAFLRDHTGSSRREDAMLLLEEIETVLDQSMEADQVRLRLQQLRRTHDLMEPKPGTIDDFAKFAEDLRKVRYSAVLAVQEETLDLTGTVETKQPTDGQPAPSDATSNTAEPLTA